MISQDAKIISRSQEKLVNGLNSICLINQKLFLSQDKIIDSEINYKEALETLFNCEFFAPDFRTWDHHLIVNTKEDGSENNCLTLTTPTIVIAPVPDEEVIYFRLHPSEPTNNFENTDQILPSRDFLLVSYPWKNLFSSQELAKLSANKALTFLDLTALFTSSRLFISTSSAFQSKFLNDFVN